MKKSKFYSAAFLSTVTAVAVGVTGVSASQMFTDVDASHKYSKGIQALAAAGIVKGYGDGTFKPEGTVTRGQAAKMIAGVLKLDTKNVKNPKFTDIKTSNQYYGSISALANAGFVKGFEDNSFRTSAKITHGQLAKIITNIGELTAEEISALVASAGVNYNPTKNTTRGELASILALVLLADEEISQKHQKRQK